MVVFGKKWLHLVKRGCIREYVVVFRDEWLYLGEVLVFGQKCLYSGKSACILAKLLYSGKWM